MHEFSIALNIVDIALEQARMNEAGQILEVEIEVGKASGVVREALEFALESAVKNTPMEHARIIILEIPVLASCRNCGCQFEGDAYITSCPSCGELSASLITGRELRVKSMVVE
jgi:hydrogenase nickel incorporation protein HypA/HybF